MGQVADFFTNAIKDFKGDVTDEILEKLPSACEEATREIREAITDIWFRGFNGEPTKGATRYIPSLTKGENGGSCVVETYTDSAWYYPIPIEAEKYLARHDYPELKDPVNWVLFQFHDLGNIGLPPAASSITGTGWVNKNPHHYNTLTSELASNPLWGRWEGLVMSKL